MLRQLMLDHGLRALANVTLQRHPECHPPWSWHSYLRAESCHRRAACSFQIWAVLGGLSCRSSPLFRRTPLLVSQLHTASSSASAVSDPSTTLNTIARAWPCLAGLGTSEVPAVTCKPTSPSGEALLTRLAAFHSPRRRRPVSPGLRRPAGRRVRLGQRFEDRSWASLALYKYSTQVHHRCERHPDGRCAAPRGGRDGPAKRPSRPCVSAGHHLVHRCGLDDQVWRSRRG